MCAILYDSGLIAHDSLVIRLIVRVHVFVFRFDLLLLRWL